MSESSIAYRCDIDSFKPDQRHEVRWLDALTTDIGGDFDLLAEFGDAEARRSRLTICGL